MFSSGLSTWDWTPHLRDVVTSRLRLAPFRIGDADELFAIRGDREAMAHWDWPADESVEQTRAVASSLCADAQRGTAVLWTVRIAASAEFAGVCDLSELDGNGSADLGFMFVRRHWGHGYAREAVDAILSEAAPLGISMVRARVHAANARSCGLLAGLGFRRAALLADFEVRPGVTRTCILFERGLAAN